MCVSAHMAVSSSKPGVNVPYVLSECVCAGACTGLWCVGMGLAFLRHVSRCRVLVHVINGDSKDPVGDFEAINAELELFSPVLAQKPQVVVLNKCDIPGVAEKAAELEDKVCDPLSAETVKI